MPLRTPEARRLAARVGHATRFRDSVPDDLRRELAEARLAEAIEKIVATAPPLTLEQRDRLAVLLTPAATA